MDRQASFLTRCRRVSLRKVHATGSSRFQYRLDGKTASPLVWSLFPRAARLVCLPRTSLIIHLTCNWFSNKSSTTRHEHVRAQRHARTVTDRKRTNVEYLRMSHLAWAMHLTRAHLHTHVCRMHTGCSENVYLLSYPSDMRSHERLYIVYGIKKIDMLQKAFFAVQIINGTQIVRNWFLAHILWCLHYS